MADIDGIYEEGEFGKLNWEEDGGCGNESIFLFPIHIHHLLQLNQTQSSFSRLVVEPLPWRLVLICSSREAEDGAEKLFTEFIFP